MKTYIVLVLVGVVVTAHGAEKTSDEKKDKRPIAINVAAANATLKEKPKKASPSKTPTSPSETPSEAPKTEGERRPEKHSHTTTKIKWSLVTKQQDKA